MASCSTSSLLQKGVFMKTNRNSQLLCYDGFEYLINKRAPVSKKPYAKPNHTVYWACRNRNTCKATVATASENDPTVIIGNKAPHSCVPSNPVPVNHGQATSVAMCSEGNYIIRFLRRNFVMKNRAESIWACRCSNGRRVDGVISNRCYATITTSSNNNLEVTKIGMFCCLSLFDLTNYINRKIKTHLFRKRPTSPYITKLWCRFDRIEQENGIKSFTISRPPVHRDQTEKTNNCENSLEMLLPKKRMQSICGDHVHERYDSLQNEGGPRRKLSSWL